jgi:quercetin dioxygenase-like cupin family protein
MKRKEIRVTYVISNDELPHSGTTHKFEGCLYGDANVSLFLSETPPGRGPDLHTHPYAEAFVVQGGDLTFTVGDATIEATGGQIVVATAGAPHKFVNSGTGQARHVDIHTSRRMVTSGSRRASSMAEIAQREQRSVSDAGQGPTGGEA